MVRLSKIYTKTGDDGTTALGDGSRLPKHHRRISCYGTVDELSSYLGMAISEGSIGEGLKQTLRDIQNDLFDLGSDLCVPGSAGDAQRIPHDYVERLESLIDSHNDQLEPLNSFVLPGGSRTAAWLHMARCVCRRAERLVVKLWLVDGEKVNDEVVRYLNRLSDLLFVLARCENNQGQDDVLWVPGRSKSES